MIQGINQKAWDILTDDERLALTLKHGHDKSTWEAGEITGRAHYKYLEIEQRAKQFLKMFTEHFDMYDELIPAYIKMDARVAKYFRLVIVKRRTLQVAVDIISDEYFRIKYFREKLILNELTALHNSEHIPEKNLSILLRDFDRWNNFRILPWEIQEPSAFKRRNKTAELKNLKNMLSLNSFIVTKLVKRYHLNKPGTRKVLYATIFSKFMSLPTGCMHIENTPEIIQEMSNMGIYVFSREEYAEIFYRILVEYYRKDIKTCREGQEFWPKFREITAKSINYNRLQKKIPSRKFLEMASRDTADEPIMTS